MKDEIIPQILEVLPNQPSKKEFSEDSLLYRFTLIFDREGYNPDFFETVMREHNIACVTYKKYQGKDWPKDDFKTIEEKSIIGGEKVIMQIAEREISINEVSGREIRKLSKGGHQTAIITTELKTPTGRLSIYMFNRWGQENFFKYMAEHYCLDRLCEFGAEDTSASEKTINPVWKAKGTEIRSKAGLINKKKQELATISIKQKKEEDQTEDIDNKAVKEYEKKCNKLYNEIIELEREKSELQAIKKEIKHYVNVAELTGQEKITQPRLTSKRLIIRLHGLSNPQSNKIVKHLINNLNETETIYPGTEMRIIYEMGLN